MTTNRVSDKVAHTLFRGYYRLLPGKSRFQGVGMLLLQIQQVGQAAVYTVSLLVHSFEVVLVDFKQALLLLEAPPDLLDHAVGCLPAPLQAQLVRDVLVKLFQHEHL